MTREEAIKSASEYLEYSWGVIDVTPLVNRIYDDFESRVCGNCKHADLYEEDGEVYDVFCNKLWERESLVFGCNKFERREDGVK